LAQILLFFIGGIQILTGNFTIGMFTIYVSYFNMMLGASKYFFGLGAFYQSALVSHNRIAEILGQKIESNGSMSICDIKKISIRNLVFGYEDKIINNFSCEFEKGKIYTIVGSNGIGKSTLINLIIGQFTDEYNGSVEYNDVDIRKIDMIAVRKSQIGVAEQEPVLLKASIGFNLFLSENYTIDDAVIENSKVLSMESFFLNKTLEYELNSDNANTSGGEKQKIAILKVLIKNPEVMIFDEPTSALDSSTAKRFVNHLSGIKDDKIIIIVTHDEQIKNLSDVVIGL
jgi:ATP-binding cassette subfamily C protein